MKQTSSCFVIFLLFIFSVGSFCEESADEGFSNTKEEYMHILKNIPVLFEYVISALQDKPEILETDNPMAFDDVTNNNAREIHKRDASSRNKVNDEENDHIFRIADDIFDEVEGLDDPESDGADEKDSFNAAENEENGVKITPEEIEEKYLMVEQMLEDYNKE